MPMKHLIEYDRRTNWNRPIARRTALQMAAMGIFGASVSGWLPRLAKAAQNQKHKSCILLWMAGGPSQLETLDPKPGNANGGPTQAIGTAVPGIHIAENFPKLAGQIKDIAILRSMKTREGDHGRATQLMMTGYRPGTGGIAYPSMGSVVAKKLQQAVIDLPPYVSIGSTPFGQSTSGFLGPKYSPLVVSGRSDDPNARANLSIENLGPTDGRQVSLEDRIALLRMLQANVDGGQASAAAHGANYESALRMVKTRGGGAFDLDQESEATRDRFGRNRFGQGCLLARRLVERGVPFVEVVLSDSAGGNWDSHNDNFNQVRNLAGVLDPAWSALLEDLRERDMLESTMVVWMGEFGRTPVINPNAGRDHFPDAWSVALSGGKIQGGQVIGKTSENGLEVVDCPISASDLFATILAGLDIDPKGENFDRDRPIRMVDDGGAVIKAALT